MIQSTVRCVFGRVVGAVALLAWAATPILARPLPLPATVQDVTAKGTPVGGLLAEIYSAEACMLCHLGDPSTAATTVMPWRWRGSMHSHSWKDPIFQAGLAIANQDTQGAAQICIRCHAPAAFLEGRSIPTSGANVGYMDKEYGVTCHLCHRLVNPVYPRATYTPTDDQAILADLASQNLIPVNPGNAQYVVDPSDLRRGPYSNANPPHPHTFSPFHLTGDLCGTCHDVSNPVFDRVGGASPDPSDVYRLNASNTPHPTQNKYDMLPEQRTYSEWLNSKYAMTGVPRSDTSDPYNLNGRFGGNRTVLQKCQDCHMPTVTNRGCNLGAPNRTDLAQHNFAAANTTALDMVKYLYTAADPTNPGPNEFVDSFDGVVTLINRQKNDNIAMLAAATDLYLTQSTCRLNARIVNQCGHKLLTGYPEGRRIWINVKFFNGTTMIAERGAYDTATATLTTGDTKVYETKFGHDEYMTEQTGLPAGHSFHLTTVNTLVKDNRIPPRGFTNAAFRAIQALPVGATYADQQHWDDTPFTIPTGATSATVTVYYQTASREYIEFLRDANTTTNHGQVLYNAWVATGKGPPVVMDQSTIPLTPFVQAGDANGDFAVGLADISMVIQNWFLTGSPGTLGDLDGDGQRGISDIAVIINNWGHTCP